LFGRRLDFSTLAFDPGINDILSFQWDFDGDGEYDDFFGSSGSWNFAKNGLYNVGLRVADGDGGFAYQSTQIRVSVPESSSVLGMLTIGALGVGATLKRKTVIS
jgi:PKD domain